MADAWGKYQPTDWATIAIAVCRAHCADRIVPERNNGGDMVVTTIRTVDQNVPVTTVWVSRGKVTRAEPVSALYEQGRLQRVGTFPQLEEQMTNFSSDFDRQAAGYSPDRVDALVWVVGDLMLAEMKGYAFYAVARRRATGETLAQIAGHAPTTPEEKRKPSLLDLYMAQCKKTMVD